MNLHTDAELPKKILEEVTQKDDDLDGEELEPDRAVKKAARSMVIQDDRAPSELLYHNLEHGESPMKTFYSLGARTRHLMDQAVEEPSIIHEDELENLGDKIVHNVQERRKSKIEQFGETYDVISLAYDLGKAKIQSMRDENNLDDIFKQSRFTSRDDLVYGVKGRELTDAFVDGYQHRAESMQTVQSYAENHFAASD